MSDVTRILRQIEAGDATAADQLLPLVYEELRKLSARKLAKEPAGQTLDATSLVHEAYLRLVDVPATRQWEGRAHFFAAAAEAMRRILVEGARRKASLKRGGAMARQALHESQLADRESDRELLELDQALNGLAEADPLAAELVKLRYFAGLSMEQAARALGMSTRTAYYTWAYARSWLRCEIQPDSERR